MNTIHFFIASNKTAKWFCHTMILILFLFLSSCKQASDETTATTPPVLPVGTAVKSSAVTFVEYPAAIKGAVDIEVRPQVSGYIQSVLVQEGAYVSAGQTLFKINDQPFQESLNNAKASMHAAEAAMMNAQLEIDKLTPLVQNKVVSEIQLKTVKTAYKIAQANYEQAKASVASAQINLGYTNVKAAVSGYIGLIPKKQGSLVSASDQMALTQLSDITKVHVYFSLAEKDFNVFNTNYQGKTPGERIKQLPAVELILADNSVYPIKGKIEMINGQFDKNTAAITFMASFDNANGTLRSGNTGKLRLGLNRDNVVLVPQSATLEIQDKIFVFAVDKENKVSKLPVTVVGKSGINYLIQEGLNDGDQIVLSGLDRLQEGQIIQPKKSAGLTAQLTNKN